MKRFLTFALLLITILAGFHPVLAQGAPSCTMNPDGSITCTTGGGGGGSGNNGGGGSGPTQACTPGEHTVYRIVSYDPDTEMCRGYPEVVDNCTGQVILSLPAFMDVPCQIPQPQVPHPCDTFAIGAGGITCSNSGWNVSARVTFPEMYLDVRPYPATLVRWPTAIRNGGMPGSSGSGGVNYIPNGGGSSSNPQVGDWRDLRLTLTLQPASPLSVTLPIVGTFNLPDAGSTGHPTLIEWEVPSHPAVGGGPLAGEVDGLEELPADMPLFAGSGRGAYRLYWELRYFEYEAEVECVPGPNGSGGYNCGGGTGHKVVVGYEWKRHSSGGEIPPLAVQNVPPSRLADINGDGIPEAFWNTNLTIRRMDEGDSVNNPRYLRSWNWGGIIYWAVREGQGQIGWPESE
ncbi:MAG: hypothetical protein C3F07_00105 [Anaerolineales bacterium]|nr:MAG: hypothetical protein C3F07_00105 [Anaerolineales bacterium]